MDQNQPNQVYATLEPAVAHQGNIRKLSPRLRAKVQTESREMESHMKISHEFIGISFI